MTADHTAPVDDIHAMCEEARAEIRARVRLLRQRVARWDIRQMPRDWGRR